jgi:hypothetical protein
MKPVVSTLNHENSLDKKSVSTPRAISQDPLNIKSSSTADELKAKLREWHSRFKNEKSSPGDKTNLIQQQNVKPNQHNKGFVQDSTLPSGASRNPTNGTSSLEVSSHNEPKALNGPSQRHLPEMSKDKNFDNSKINATDHSMKTADFTGPLSLSEILKRKKSTSTLQKKSKPQNSEPHEKQRVHSLHSPSSLHEVVGLGKRQMTSKDGQYVISQSDKTLKKKDTGEIQPIVKPTVNQSALQLTPNELILPKPSRTSPSSTSTKGNIPTCNTKNNENSLPIREHLTKMNSSSHSFKTSKGDMKQIEKNALTHASKGTANDVSKPVHVENLCYQESMETISTDSLHCNTTSVEPLVLPLPSSSDQVSNQANSLQTLTLPKIEPTKISSPQSASPTFSMPMVSFQQNITPVPLFTSTVENSDKDVLNTTTPPLVIATTLHTSSIENLAQTSTTPSLSDSKVVLETSSSLKPVQSFIQHISLQSTIIPTSTVQEICPVSVLSKTVQSFASNGITPLLLKRKTELPFKTQDVPIVNPTLHEKTNTDNPENNTVNVVGRNETYTDETTKAPFVAASLLENTLTEEEPESCLQAIPLTSPIEPKKLPMGSTSILSPNTSSSDSHSSSTSCSPKLSSINSQTKKNCLIEKSKTEEVSKRITTPHSFSTTLPLHKQNFSNTFSSSSTFLDKVDLKNTLEHNSTMPSAISKSTDSDSHLVYNMKQISEDESHQEEVFFFFW